MDPAILQVLHGVLALRQSGKAVQLALPGADLRGAQLMRADLLGADLSGAGLDHCNLAGSKLGGANLQAALLRWAELEGADLTGADLRGADLSWARLEGCALADADLRGAILVGAVGQPATVAGARIDKATADRSRLGDADVIQLWNEGAAIEDLERFPERVKNACSPASIEILSEAGPPTRKLSDVEREARRQRLKQDDQTPPSSLFSSELARLSQRGEPGGAASLRSLRLVAGILTPAMLAAPEWRKGDRVLGAELESEIGEGSAARVWRARRGDGEIVAVKLFNHVRASVGLTLPAYRRGVQVMNRLCGRPSAPASIVQLLCVSLNKLGFMMPLAANGSAVDLPALGWNERSAVRFFEKLCEAVAAAHAAGVLHRCMKPSNVLLDADLQPILCDFDIVDLPTLAGESRDARGYAAYAAPEELLGAGTQSPTADVYSLGRFLHFLLAKGDPDEPAAEVPELASLRGQHEGLVRIVRKCTVRAPEERYQWVSELLEDVRRYEEVDGIGLAGGAPRSSFGSLRVSALTHDTPWLVGRGEKGKSNRPAAEQEPRLAAKPTRQQARALAAEENERLEAERRRDKLVAALGAALLLVSMVAIELGDAGETMLWRMRLLSAAGGAGVSFFIPAAGKPIVRVAALLAAGALAYVLDLPGFLAG